MTGDKTLPSVPAPFLQAGLEALLLDRVTAEVHGALAAAGIPSIVLKGPAIANWLYHGDEVRGYGDSDLLIPHDRWQAAGEVLAQQGFRNFYANMAHPRMESYASDPWFRGDQDVDLHSTIYGIEAPHGAVWGVLSEDQALMEIGGEMLPVLGEPARALHVALHAAQHQDGKAVHDLEKAIAQLPEETWRLAADIANRLEALPAFAAGLRLTDDGEALARRMGIEHVRSTHTDLRAGQVPLAESLNELLETPGIVAKLRVGVAEVFPKPRFMRWWMPLANRGRAGMAVAYLWRPVYIVSRLPAAIRAVYRARRTRSDGEAKT
jgi:hypothetical protein